MVMQRAASDGEGSPMRVPQQLTNDGGVESINDAHPGETQQIAAAEKSAPTACRPARRSALHPLRELPQMAADRARDATRCIRGRVEWMAAGPCPPCYAALRVHH